MFHYPINLHKDIDGAFPTHAGAAVGVDQPDSLGWYALDLEKARLGIMSHQRSEVCKASGVSRVNLDDRVVETF